MDEDFLRRTYRSVAVVTAIVLFFLASYGLFWALMPFIVGAGLGIGLLYAMERFVRATFSPERVAPGNKNLSGTRPKLSLLLFALVKYPLVAVLIWAIARGWQTREVAVFTGGFVLVHFVLFLRGVGSYITENRSDRSHREKPEDESSQTHEDGHKE